jgi:hypothetical protein
MIMDIGAKDVDSPAARALAKKTALEGTIATFLTLTSLHLKVTLT